MKKAEKQMIAILIIVTIIIIGIVFIITRISRPEEESIEQQEDVITAQPKERYVQTMDDGTKLNISTKFNEQKDLGDIIISNIQLTEKDSQTVFLADATNNSNVNIKETEIDIILYNDDGSEITTINGIISGMKPGETVKIDATTTLDFANAYDFQIVLKDSE